MFTCTFLQTKIQIFSYLPSSSQVIPWLVSHLGGLRAEVAFSLSHFLAVAYENLTVPISSPSLLPHKDWSIPLSVLLKDTASKVASFFSTLSFFCWVPSRVAVNTIFKSLLVWLDLGNEPWVYQLQSGCSNHYAIVLVMPGILLFWKSCLH